MKRKTFLFGWPLLVMPVAVQAQFNYTVTNGVVTITGYTGTNGVAVIPDTITGLPVIAIGDAAFFQNISLTSVSIPNSVTKIGGGAFALCANLASITIPDSVTSIGGGAFARCANLTNASIGYGVTNISTEEFAWCARMASLTIPNGVVNICQGAFLGCSNLTSINIPDSVVSISALGGSQYQGAFRDCSGLTNVTIGRKVSNIAEFTFEGCACLTSVVIPSSVSNLGGGAFADCTKLASAYFQGNAPGNDFDSFMGDLVTVYYLPGTAGWGPTFGGSPTAFWTLPYPLILNNTPSLGVQTNQFSFIIFWATNRSIVVEGSSDLVNSKWCQVTTNSLSGGFFRFSDPQWTNYPSRFYRVRSQ